MKDEIKEILDFKEDADCKRLSVDEIIILKDCITNLQEEIERLKMDIRYWEDKWQYTKFSDKDYKSRIDKAIEYIENDLKSFLYSIEYKTLLNILNGGDE